MEGLYGQRFLRSGTYSYDVLPVHGECVMSARRFVIRVEEERPGGAMKQHAVVVRSERGRLRAEPSEITIGAGDLVVWKGTDGPEAYVVVGERPFFNSARVDATADA